MILTKKKNNCFLPIKAEKVSKNNKLSKQKGCKIFLSSNSDWILIKYWKSLDEKLAVLGYPCVFFHLPITKKRITLLKSPHVNKKAKEQFELVTHKMVIILHPEIDIFSIKNFFIKKPASVSLKLVLNDINLFI